MYDEFGPTPEICFGLLEDEARLANYRYHRKAALKGFSFEAIYNMVAEANKFNVEDMSHLLLTKPVPKEELIQMFAKTNREFTDGAEFVFAGFEPITGAVRQKIAEEIASKDYNERRSLYNYLGGFVGMKHLVDLAFQTTLTLFQWVTGSRADKKMSYSISRSSMSGPSPPPVGMPLPLLSLRLVDVA